MPDSDLEQQQHIIDYYLATTEAGYLRHWAGESLALHLGIGDASSRSLDETLDNTNRFLADSAGIGPGSRVLDAGCGVGGSAIWLARERGARVTGINIVERHLELARDFAVQRGVASLVDFERADMLETGFAPGSFDVVWNLESMCHLVDLDRYLAHAMLLLRGGGRLVGIDICRGPVEDRALEDAVCEGWALPRLRTQHEIQSGLTRAGFVNVALQDLAVELELSLRELEARASRSLFALSVEERVLGSEVSPRYLGHVRAALAFVKGMRSSAISMLHFRAERPEGVAG